MEEEEEEEGTSHRDCLVRERISPFFTCSRDVSRELQEEGEGVFPVKTSIARTRNWNISRFPRDKLEPISRLSVNLSFLDLWLCKPRLAGRFGDALMGMCRSRK